jgi:hypothetical protein
MDPNGMKYYKGLEREHWWDQGELVYDYDLSGLHKRVLDLKNERSGKLLLAQESYDFVMFMGQYV